MRLEPNLDVAEAGRLWSALIAAKGSPLAIDASAVERLGAPCLQVLLSAKACWDAEGWPFSIASASDAFRSTLELMGAANALEVGT